MTVHVWVEMVTGGSTNSIALVAWTECGDREGKPWDENPTNTGTEAENAGSLFPDGRVTDMPGLAGARGLSRVSKD